jgi:hypothetical protein
MFGKVKKWLGIEGIKIDIEIPEAISLKDDQISGSLIFYTMHPQTVTGVKVIMKEKYIRGRRKSKLTDEYILGEIYLDTQFDVIPDEAATLEFTLPFERIRSEMDEIEEGNLLMGGIIKAAKFIKGAKSIYTIIVEAKVKGVALSPFSQQEVRIK